MPKRDITLVAVILAAVLLVLSWQSYTANRSLQEEVAGLRSELGNLRYNISQDVSRVAAAVYEMREDARWWNLAGTSLEDYTLETAYFRVSWQIKDYRRGSTVVFYYRQGDDKDFTEITPEEGAGGFFSVLIPVKMPQEPLWDMHVSYSTGRGGAIIEEKAERGYYMQETSYQYFFSVEDEGTLRSSDIQRLHVGDLWARLYNPLYGNVDVQEDGTIYIHLDEMRQYQEAAYQLEDVRLEVRQGGRLVETHSLRGNIKLGSVDATLDPLEAGQSLYIILDYSSGKTVEREISISFSP